MSKFIIILLLSILHEIKYGYECFISPIYNFFPKINCYLFFHNNYLNTSHRLDFIFFENFRGKAYG